MSLGYLIKLPRMPNLGQRVFTKKEDGHAGKAFKLKEHGTDVKTEIIAGVTTFMTMAYIIFVNPMILSGAGMDRGAVTTATILSAAITTFLMGIYVNYPFALASGMGLNAFFTSVVAAQYGWEAALGAVSILVAEGVHGSHHGIARLGWDAQRKVGFRLLLQQEENNSLFPGSLSYHGVALPVAFLNE